MSTEEPEATEGTGKGAWIMRCTIDGKSGGSGWEKYWDPDAMPISEAEAEVHYQGVLEILFGPSPDDA